MSKVFKVIVTGLAAIAVLATQANARAGLIQGFTGAYAPDNWSLNKNGGNGSVNFSQAPISITLTGSDSESYTEINTDFTIKALASGFVSFGWDYTSVDDPGFDSFGFLRNDTFFLITVAQGSGASSFSVEAGDIFGFRVYSVDDEFGPGIVVIDNFSAPIPEPSALLLVGSVVGAGLVRRRRR
jgi:hypothetical protein